MTQNLFTLFPKALNFFMNIRVAVVGSCIHLITTI